MFGAKQLVSATALVLVFLSSVLSVEIDPNEVDEQGVFDTRVSYGDTTGIITPSGVEDLFNLEKRQQCVAGYGTCPGGRACACPLSGANCCYGLCKYLAQVCCVGPYLCASGEQCCGNNNCAPANGECCDDGGYCPAGSYCIRYDGETRDRCRVYGQTSAYTRSTQATYISQATTAITTSYIPQATATAATRYYTITYTIYYYYYYYYSTVYTIVSSRSTYSTFRSSYTSTPTLLSAYATGSYDASTQLSSDVSSIQSSFSSDALLSSSSMSSAVSSYSASVSRAQASNSQAQASNTGSGSLAGGSTAGSSLHQPQDSKVLMVSGLLVSIIGALALCL